MHGPNVEPSHELALAGIAADRPAHRPAGEVPSGRRVAGAGAMMADSVYLFGALVLLGVLLWIASDDGR